MKIIKNYQIHFKTVTISFLLHTIVDKNDSIIQIIFQCAAQTIIVRMQRMKC